MKNQINFRTTIKFITVSAMIAAIYTVATVAMGTLGFGQIQFRVSEALTLLPFLFPQTIVGIFVGCLLSNILASPYMLDIVLGSSASLVAAIWTSKIKNKYLAPLPPVLINAVVVGFIITFSMSGNKLSDIGLIAYLTNTATVGIGQAVVCYGLGLPLIAALQKRKHSFLKQGKTFSDDKD